MDLPVIHSILYCDRHLESPFSCHPDVCTNLHRSVARYSEPREVPDLVAPELLVCAESTVGFVSAPENRATCN